jgi:cell division protein FtsI/penicillin-binding protein 2
MLVGVTENGTAKRLGLEDYQVAGKTGTAQKLIDGRYSKRNHVGSFVGFFPASNPEVVISVIVDDARIEGSLNYGSQVAMPTFRNVAARLIPYLDIQPVAGRNSPYFAMQGGRQ